ncbi:MAG: HAMP domain-containing sensor histidine kinase [Clostridiaceae bacterium]|nr:HAMP domain-containing sensor histidine kinase [Clostridiaceae bacterium]
MWKSFCAWLALVFGLMLLACGGYGIFTNLNTITTLLPDNNDYYQSGSFIAATHANLSEMLYALQSPSSELFSAYRTDDGTTLYRIRTLEPERNIVYYAGNNSQSEYVYSNIGIRDTDVYLQQNYPAKFVFALYYAEGVPHIWLYGADVTQDYASYYQDLFSYSEQTFGLPSDVFTLYYAVGLPGMPVSEYGSVGAYYQSWLSARTLSIISLSFAAVGLLLLILSLIFYRARRPFMEALLRVLGRVPLEGKALAAMVMLWLMYLGIDAFYYSGFIAAPALVLGACLLWPLFLDMVTHRRAWLRMSVCGIVLRACRRVYLDRARQTPLERRCLHRLWLLVGAEAVLVSLAVINLFLAANYYSRTRYLFGFFCCAALGIFAFWLFMRSYRSLLSDLGTVRGMTAALREGHLAEVQSPLPETHDLYPLADDLLHLRDGVLSAVDARVRSERMKSELVTNVSHDLKTPLTSIISYSRLLDELNLPEPANAYVKVLREKSERLQKLTRDLFEVSKAQSGSLPVKLTRLDLASHLEQTLAELSERIDASGLAFRVRTPGHPVYIDCDGERLYRVLENLTANALAYACPGTRVYVTLDDSGPVTLSIRNVAAYEMTFTADEIAERFVRGDASRTDGGTGLGLAIAKSFTEAVGGGFAVDIDGDVFRVTLSFPKQEAPIDTTKENEANHSCESVKESVHLPSSSQ